MDTINIYRIEHHGCYDVGPYNYYDDLDLCGDLKDTHSGHYTHPGPYREHNNWDIKAVEVMINRGASFGCESLKALHKWFSYGDFIPRLEEAGFSVVKYTVPCCDCITGDYQAIFLKENAKRKDLSWKTLRRAK